MGPTTRATTVAFYLPQFHPTPENDRWWWLGYTEWDLVRQAMPLYPGHRQPRRPTELGFYDLRSEEARAAQAVLASDHGVSAFCYWYYWSSGTRLLGNLLDDIVRSGVPDIDFMLGWANATWRDVTPSGGGRVLLPQRYGDDGDLRQHIRWLGDVVSSPRYVRVDGRPSVVVYRPDELPLGYVDRMRSCAHAEGIGELHLIAYDTSGTEPMDRSFDAALSCVLPQYEPDAVPRPQRVVYDDLDHDRMLSGPPGGTAYPCVISGWDHTPRSGHHGLVVEHDSPARFGAIAARAVHAANQGVGIAPLVFLKSWNEWSEGNYLEPDERWGRAYLEALAEVNLA